MTYEQILELAKKGEITIVDVRTKEEYDMGRIPTAINCDVQTIMRDAPNVLTSKDHPYYVYCQTGYRSKVAAMQLDMMGYTNINDLGGIIDWPLEIEY